MVSAERNLNSALFLIISLGILCYVERIVFNFLFLVNYRMR